MLRNISINFDFQEPAEAVLSAVSLNVKIRKFLLYEHVVLFRSFLK